MVEVVGKRIYAALRLHEKTWQRLTMTISLLRLVMEPVTTIVTGSLCCSYGTAHPHHVPQCAVQNFEFE
jgi:hypothetical protein